MAFNVKLHVIAFPTTQEDYDGIMEDYTLPENVDIHTELLPSGVLLVSADATITEQWYTELPGIYARNNTKSEASIAKWRHLLADIDSALSDDLIMVWAENLLGDDTEPIHVFYSGMDDEMPIGGSYAVDNLGDIIDSIDIADIWDA